jgi:phage host-nuclease inhibitor protein Gam
MFQADVNAVVEDMSKQVANLVKEISILKSILQQYIDAAEKNENK